jgi:hypothetical protein
LISLNDNIGLLIIGVRQKRHSPRPLDGSRDLALVPGTGAGPFFRQDLEVGIDEAPQGLRVLIIDLAYIIYAEMAHFFFFYRLIVVHILMKRPS